MKPYRGFADLLHQRRTACDLTLQQLADKLEMSRQYLSELERGAKSPPPERHLRRMAEVLSVDFEMLRREAELSRPEVTIDVRHLPLTHRQAALAVAQRFAEGLTDADVHALLTWAGQHQEVAS